MLNNQILAIKSKNSATEIAKLALTNDDTFKVLINNCESDNVKLAQKSAWVISAMFDYNPSYFNNQLNNLWSLILKQLPGSVERSLIRIVSKFDIPEAIESKAFDLCMERLTNANTAIANRAMAFDIAYNLCKKYPELKQELALVIPLLSKLASPGLLVKVRKINM